MTTFGDRLERSFLEGRRLCVGIDPHNSTLDIWGLAQDASGAERLGRRVVEEAAGLAAFVKPQIALFERFGSHGFVALERILADARAAKLPVIADVKRGDIGSTFEAYAQAWLAPGSPLEADAMTVHAYHGVASLTGALPFVKQHGKGLFVLAATSNPEARDLQRAKLEDGSSVAAHVVHRTRTLLAEHSRIGSLGVVIGSTVSLEDYGIEEEDATEPAIPILAPGFGHQGAKVENIHNIFGNLARGVIVSESRSILNGGAQELRARIEHRHELVQEVYE